MTTCTCFTVPTSGPETCGWCGILPEPAPIGPAPTSLADRLAPALADAASYQAVASDPMIPAFTRYTLFWMADKARETARATAQLWAIGA